MSQGVSKVTEAANREPAMSQAPREPAMSQGANKEPGNQQGALKASNEPESRQ